jgi:hypothetical protein
MNNPPAFPLTSNWHNELKHYNGMGLRDYMAAKAMQGLFASGHYEGKVNIVEVAKTAYTMADAMLKAREA